MDRLTADVSRKDIKAGSLIISDTDAKWMTGAGSFGLVFGTRLDTRHCAVKRIHCPRHWRDEFAKLKSEVILLTLSLS